jgi:DNA (cytosine-5)-methyltransferase 1
VKLQVIDLFCGVGGLTRGILNLSIPVIAGFDIDNTCKFAYEHNNNGVQFFNKDVKNVTGKMLNKLYSKNSIRVLVGCAPCQSFSNMASKWGRNEESDERWNLLLEFGRIIKECLPDIVSMENVPKIQKTDVFAQFLQILHDNKYEIDYKTVYCPKYGIPQNRRRTVLLASRFGPIKIIPETHGANEYPTVRQYIEGLPCVAAGEICDTDALHKTATLSELNLKRIKNSRPGGSWKDWDVKLRTNCHRKKSGATYTSVYARMEWDKIAPTMTTQFYCYGTGRYGHPEQDRALTLREGALLQTFPEDYQFFPEGSEFSIKTIARHIGNAVPVKLGESIGQSILTHTEEMYE